MLHVFENEISLWKRSGGAAHLRILERTMISSIRILVLLHLRIPCFGFASFDCFILFWLLHFGCFICFASFDCFILVLIASFWLLHFGFDCFNQNDCFILVASFWFCFILVLLHLRIPCFFCFIWELGNICHHKRHSKKHQQLFSKRNITRFYRKTGNHLFDKFNIWYHFSFIFLEKSQKRIKPLWMSCLKF